MAKRGERVRIHNFFDVNKEDINEYSPAYEVLHDVLSVWFGLEEDESIMMCDSSRIYDSGTPGYTKLVQEVKDNPKEYKLMQIDNAHDGPHMYEYAKITRYDKDVFGYPYAILTIVIHTMYGDDTANIGTVSFDFVDWKEKEFCRICKYALENLYNNKENNPEAYWDYIENAINEGSQIR